MNLFWGSIVGCILCNFNFFQYQFLYQFLLHIADVRHFKNLFSVWKGVMEEVPTRYMNLLPIILKLVLII